MQSIGLLIGAAFTMANMMTAAILTITFFFGFCGFFDRGLPPFLHWLKYLNVLLYGYHLSMLVMFDGLRFTCDTPSSYKVCPNKDIELEDVMKVYGIVMSKTTCFLVLLGAMIACRFLAYRFLRYRLECDDGNSPAPEVSRGMNRFELRDAAKKASNARRTPKHIAPTMADNTGNEEKMDEVSASVEFALHEEQKPQRI